MLLYMHVYGTQDNDTTANSADVHRCWRRGAAGCYHALTQVFYHVARDLLIAHLRVSFISPLLGLV